MFVRRKLTSHLPDLKAYSLALCRNEDEANDLVQEAVKKALSAKRIPKSKDELKPWLFRIIRNTYIDVKRREANAAEYFDDVSRLYSGSPVEHPKVLEEILVRQALENLTARDREILYLIDVLGFKYAEAAIVLGVAEGTIMSRVSRARSALLGKIETTNVKSFKVKVKRNGNQ
ncbi:RNA polymerase sigma factor [Sneathiella glossodoripedis]|uniref:RNA polymerase sigma factor n=1 Tax=Sneathiella glossodoripedis TaxID=418853 RepID=UPI000472B9A5|nr:RNA polymerase sigma factor [Sneathiella glossodoripedis]